MSAVMRNLVDPEVASANRAIPGAYTFNAPIPADYSGICFVVAALRLGDHAHLDVFSGHHAAAPDGSYEGTRRIGRAGRLCLRWHEWIALRDMLEQHPCILVREVEKPTRGNLDRHVA